MYLSRLTGKRNCSHLGFLSLCHGRQDLIIFEVPSRLGYSVVLWSCDFKLSLKNYKDFFFTVKSIAKTFWLQKRHSKPEIYKNAFPDRIECKYRKWVGTSSDAALALKTTNSSWKSLLLNMKILARVEQADITQA